MPGHPDWQGQATLSQAIPAINAVTVTVPPLGVQSAVGQITRQGYEISLTLVNLTSGTVVTPVKVEMVWQESQTSAVTGYQRWWVFSGDQTGAHNLVGHGPSNGNRLTVIITNILAGTPTLDATISVMDVARPYLTHDWRTRDDLGPVWPGQTSVTSDVAAGIIGTAANLSIPAGQSKLFTMPLFTGRVLLKQFSGSTPHSVLINATAAQPSALQGQPMEASSTTGQTVVTKGYLPRVQCVMQLENTGATSATTVFDYLSTPD